MSRKIGNIGVFAVAIMMLSLALPAVAQNRIMKGKITNEKGEPIVGAKVLIQGTDMKREYTTKSDKKGEYFYMGVAFGEYRIVVRADGYQPDYIEHVKPSIAQETENNFQLKAGADRKLAFELSPEELAKIKQEAAGAEKQKRQRE